MEMPVGLAALVGSVFGSGGVLAIGAWLFKRWMDRVDARLDRLDQDNRTCSVSFRTKAEADRDWAQARAERDEQWSKINNLASRVTRIEAVCEMKHGK